MRRNAERVADTLDDTNVKTIMLSRMSTTMLYSNLRTM